MSILQKEEKIARISDILEQIDGLNEMVNFHREKSKEKSMQTQYEKMRNDFFEELELLLSSFQIVARIEKVAA